MKKDQKGKTGRFGVGFNAAYHLTDLPSFVSGELTYFCLFVCPTAAHARYAVPTPLEDHPSGCGQSRSFYTADMCSCSTTLTSKSNTPPAYFHIRLIRSGDISRAFS